MSPVPLFLPGRLIRSIADARSQTTIFLGYNTNKKRKKKTATGEEDGLIMPEAKDSEM